MELIAVKVHRDFKNLLQETRRATTDVKERFVTTQDLAELHVP